MTKLTENNCLEKANPKLAKQWNIKRNGNLTPRDILPNSNKKVWWKCDKGHEWEAVVYTRNKGVGCPFCSGKKATKETSLGVVNPELALQWHPTLNEKLTPYDILPHSNKKVWWMCKEGHEWEKSVSHRSKGRGCPYCANKKVYQENSLMATNPDLAKQWHPTMNGSLTPNDVLPGTEKKVWWLGKCNHEWEALICSRNRGHGCPYCSNQKALYSRTIACLFPKLLKEWDYDKNNLLTPEKILPNSNMKVWWICKKGHGWEAVVATRTKGAKCPYCAGQRATKQNSLGALNMELSKEWDNRKNKDVNVFQVMPNSNKKYWWKCSKGHEWEATVASRNAGRGCPICVVGANTSFPEQAIYYYLKKVFNRVLNRNILTIKNENIELDIYIPRINLGIEYDGYRWHKSESMISKDEKKNEILKDRIKVIRIRERGLPLINNCGHSVFYRNDKSEKSLDIVIKNILDDIKENFCLTADELDNMEKLSVDISKDRMFIYNMMKSVEAKNSLAIKNERLAKQWNYTKNYELLPEHVTCGSNKIVWWKCDKGHEWQASINSRNRGRECPFCSGKKVCSDNCLEAINPKLAHEWHHEKNVGLSVKDFRPGSHKKVWWICKCGHEWKAQIKSRNSGSGCPMCSGRKK